MSVLAVPALLIRVKLVPEQGLDQAVHGKIRTVDFHQGEPPQHANGKLPTSD